MTDVQNRMEAKTDACQEKIYASQEKTDANLQEMKNGQAKIKSRVSANLEKMESCLEKTQTMDLEANPRELQSIVVHQEVPKGEAAVETIRAPGQWWLPEKVGRYPQTDDPPCHSCTA
jgi:hypothetical protein